MSTIYCWEEDAPKEITPDILYQLFKDIPVGISPGGHNIFEPDIDYSEGMSEWNGAYAGTG
jgi:hypothetical protein